ncbi:MAG: hypothetical protein IJE74_00585 [Clostridia bacterium]|nr:hypothetical protein [Clostridia bacterium]
MIAYFLERPYLIAILAALVVLTLFVCVKAGQASARRGKINEALIKKLKEENALRNEFAVLTESLVKKSDSARLFRGVALNLQKKISDAKDMDSEFEKLTDAQKQVYALSFVVEDGGNKLSEFFRINGKPVTNIALDAVKKLFNGRTCEIFESEYNSFDPDNEEASVIPAEIEKLDAEFADLADENTVCAAGGRFIAENIEKFI